VGLRGVGGTGRGVGGGTFAPIIIGVGDGGRGGVGLGGVRGGGIGVGPIFATIMGVGDGGRGGVGLGGVGRGGGMGGTIFAHITQLPTLERVVVYAAVAKNTRMTIAPIMRSLRVMVFLLLAFWPLNSSLDDRVLRA
jgi:hypothetical protein